MSEIKEKDSNELLNFLLIIIGLLFIVKAIMDFLGWAGIIDLDIDPAVDQISIFGTQALLSVVLGFWALVGGLGMIREQEWALGISLVVLSIMAVTNLSIIITWFGDPSPFDAGYWVNYLIILAFILGVVGFFWLVFTAKRYD
ncbi:MAG: hypothetical protein ACFFAS_04455 [Promethearchaeota archaeon]